jgi:transposase
MTAKGDRDDRDLAARLKAKVALAALRGDRTLAELAKEFNLAPDQIEQWKRELEQNADAVFFRSEIAPDELPTLPNARPLSKPPTRPTQPALSEQPTLPQLQPVLKSPTLGTHPRSTQDAGTLSGALLDDDYWKSEHETQAPHGGTRSKTIAPAPLAGAARTPTRTRKLLAPFFAGWREKHYAARISRELLELHRTVAAAHPRLTKHELYRQIVMARVGGTLAAADAALDRAADSFASWPVERPLTFRDVVHYLAVSDYLAANGDVAEWTRENLGKVVSSIVPDDL